MSQISTQNNCYSKMKFKNDKLINYCSGFTRHQPCHIKFKRIHHDSEETKPCHFENDTKTLISGFLSQASMRLILLFTQLF